MKTNQLVKFGMITMLVGLSSCMRSQSVAYDVDDAYGVDEKGEMIAAQKNLDNVLNPYGIKVPMPSKSQNQNPDYIESERYANDGEEYYEEDGTRLSSRNLNRTNSNRPGYFNGYEDGFNSASRNWGWGNNFYSYAPSFGLSPFSYSPFAYNSFGSSMFMNPYRSMYSPFGFDSFYGNSFYNQFYSPFGYNSFNDPFNSYGFRGYNSYYSNYYRNPYYGNSYTPYAGYQPVLANNNSSATTTRRSDRYGDGGRSGGRSNGTYNDGFQNTPKTAKDESRRTYDSGRSTSNGGSEYAAPRRNGTSIPQSVGTGSQRQSSTGGSNSEGTYSRPSTSNRQPQKYSDGNSEYSRPTRTTRTESSESSGSSNNSDYNRTRTESYKPSSSQTQERSSGSSNSGSSSWGGGSSSGSSSSGSSDGGARSRGPR